ncbi:hypothetical protein GALMADRAFT_138554 [Galerina marginata CBS 339.88]|uniref:Uncharacterized protein n=1 Tax=Galerina marginata (strain CBS 339.88) TaxID=685588 RepID=A0A067TES8_GALM3|nr:hypothetical protein GALMADRAFT_138554 [Galerina marginata CBS 339.88]
MSTRETELNGRMEVPDEPGAEPEVSRPLPFDEAPRSPPTLYQKEREKEAAEAIRLKTERKAKRTRQNSRRNGDHPEQVHLPVLLLLVFRIILNRCISGSPCPFTVIAVFALRVSPSLSGAFIFVRNFSGAARKMKPSPVFDYGKDGIVFVQNGTIFYSPNCARLVKIPSANNNEPFKQDYLNYSMFKQPAWWSGSWGWQSFIPLSPSFTSLPFETFCWMPRILEVGVVCKLPSGEEQVERRYQMDQDDISIWKHRESLLTNAAQTIRLQYTIPSARPPPPLSFHYDRPHKSFSIAKKMICVSRDWFIVWMGFLSYIISQTKVRLPSSAPVLPSSPLPFWYNYLRDTHKYHDSWLDGLSLSTVYSFDVKTPRAGIVFQWSERDPTRPSIDYFYENHIPMYFMWTSAEEQAISRDGSLAYLQPPTDLVQEALTFLFRTPNLPLAGLVMQQYFSLGDNPVTNETLQFLRIEHAPSFVFNFVAEKFVDQTASLQRVTADTSLSLKVKALAASQEMELHAAAESAVTLPFHGMLDRGEDTGKLYNHFDDFFEARSRRQAELIKLESRQDRHRRESRERIPGVHNATMYTWEKTRSSGGKELYMRVRVNQDCNQDVYWEYRPSQRCYNAYANEWDLCQEFHFGSDRGYAAGNDDSGSDDYDNDYNDGYDSDYDNQHDGDGNGHLYTAPPEPKPLTPVPQGDYRDADAGDKPQPSYSRDVLDTAKLVYGYVSPYDHVPPPPTALSWTSLLGYLGFVTNLSDLSISEPDERALVVFFAHLAKDQGAGIPPHLWDLTDGTFTSSSSRFDISFISRPSEDLFVFSSPRSRACQWVLGVHSAAAALYVCRFILTNPAAHTLLTVAHRLVGRGIPFRTLLPLECSPRQVTVSREFTPTSHRLLLHQFTFADFQASMLQCRMILLSPQGRAALLRGGIVARIAKLHISDECAFEGPSVEVTAHRVGYLMRSEEDGTCLCDDELTEHEIAIICGTYSLYTPHKQEAVWSWFPPPSAWQAARCGNKWLDWTERCEDLFLKILYDIRHNNLAPKSRQGWIECLKGQKPAKVLAEANFKQAKMFMTELLPVQNLLEIDCIHKNCPFCITVLMSFEYSPTTCCQFIPALRSAVQVQLPRDSAEPNPVRPYVPNIATSPSLRPPPPDSRKPQRTRMSPIRSAISSSSLGHPVTSQASPRGVSQRFATAAPDWPSEKALAIIRDLKFLHTAFDERTNWHGHLQSARFSFATCPMGARRLGGASWDSLNCSSARLLATDQPPPRHQSAHDGISEQALAIPAVVVGHSRLSTAFDEERDSSPIHSHYSAVHNLNMVGQDVDQDLCEHSAGDQTTHAQITARCLFSRGRVFLIHLAQILPSATYPSPEILEPQGMPQDWDTCPLISSSFPATTPTLKAHIKLGLPITFTDSDPECQSAGETRESLTDFSEVPTSVVEEEETEIAQFVLVGRMGTLAQQLLPLLWAAKLYRLHSPHRLPPVSRLRLVKLPFSVRVYINDFVDGLPNTIDFATLRASLQSQLDKLDDDDLGAFITATNDAMDLEIAFRNNSVSRPAPQCNQACPIICSEDH